MLRNMLKAKSPLKNVSLNTELTSGDGRTVTVADVVNIYRNTVSKALPVEAEIRKIDDNCLGVKVIYSATSCDSWEKIKTSKEFFVQLRPSILWKCIAPNNKDAAHVTKASDDGKYVAHLRNQHVEIWKESSLIRIINTSDLEEHGLINMDETFGNISWSNRKLLYACQRKKEKHLDFFKPAKKTSGNSADSDTRGDEFIREENWGEGFTDVTHTVLAIYDVEKNTFDIIDVDGVSLATPQWLCKGSKIVCVGYNENPRKLGLLHCNNRNAKIYIYDASTLELERVLGDEALCYHTIRVNNVGDKFLFLSNPKFGPHHHSNNFNLYDVTSNEFKCILSEVFVNHIPLSCFSEDDKWIVLTVKTCLNNMLSTLSIDGEHITKQSNLTILGYKHNFLVLSKSSTNQPPSLIFTTYKSGNDPLDLNFVETSETLQNIEYKLKLFDTPDGPISALITRPLLNQSPNSLPTICNIHGGPSANFIDTYIPGLIMYAKLGFQCLNINYRGSTGCSQKFLEKINGNVGSIDVGDCLFVIKEMIKLGEINGAKLIISGGSHGGLIAGHLSCQADVEFRCAIIRNPAADVLSSLATTDIPDWCFTVALGQKHFDFGKPPSFDELQKMYEVSPLSKISKACVPTLMLLGNQDNRVKMFQGERWVNILAANGIDVECKVYNDKHALDKPDVAADSFISAAIWMMKHLK